MDNTINNDIIEKVTIKSVAIYKAIGMLPPIETKDLWEEKNSIEHQKNYENKNVSETNDTMKDTKMPSMPNDWRDITDPKLKEKMRKKVWREVNRDKINLKRRVYYAKNKDKENLRSKSYHIKHKEQIKLKRKIYLKANKEQIKSKHKIYLKTNKDKINKHNRERKKTDIQFRLASNLRNRLGNALKGNYKSGSAVKDLGCTIDEFKLYLESKFQPGMTWDNWGQHGWHIDHIKPLASFDLTDRKQMLEACHYTNLQPLWAEDNLIKGAVLAYQCPYNQPHYGYKATSCQPLQE